MKTTLLISGANSALAKDIIAYFKKKNYQLILLTRNKIKTIKPERKIVNIIYDFKSLKQEKKLKDFISKNKIKISAVLHFNGVLDFSTINSISDENFMNVYEANCLSFIKIVQLVNQEILFGDAGSATLLCKQKNSKIYFHLGSEINGYDKLILNNSGFRDFKLNCPNFYMDGKEVFNFAIRNVPKISRSICKFSKIKINQLDYFVFHQANKMMLDKIFEELEIKEKKRLFSIEKFGNTSSASIPITLSFHKSKVANKNVNILISGFGAGFSYASAILNLKQTKIFHTNFYG